MQHVASQIHNCFASHPRIDVAFADCELLIGLICQVMLFLDDAVLIGPANPQHQIESSVPWSGVTQEEQPRRSRG
jgi:hypothetical protein